MSSIFERCMHKVAGEQTNYGKPTTKEVNAANFNRKTTIADRNQAESDKKNPGLSPLDTFLSSIGGPGKIVDKPLLNDNNKLLLPAMVGTGVLGGGTAGYYLDKENPTRGAITGAIGMGGASWGLHRVLKYLGVIR